MKTTSDYKLSNQSDHPNINQKSHSGRGTNGQHSDDKKMADDQATYPVLQIIPNKLLWTNSDWRIVFVLGKKRKVKFLMKRSIMNKKQTNSDFIFSKKTKTKTN